MTNRNVKLKNVDGEYLYPYTENIPKDATPVSNSSNPITSGAVYTALQNKLDKTGTAQKATSDGNGNNIASTYALKNTAVSTLGTSGTISLSDNSVNRIKPTGNVTFSLPSVSNNNIFHQILVQLTLTSAYTIALGTSKYFNSEAPTFEVGSYDIIYEHNGSNWVVGAISVG